MRISRSLSLASAAALALVLIAQVGVASAVGVQYWHGHFDDEFAGRATVVIPPTGVVTAKFTVFDLAKKDVVDARIIAGDCHMKDGAVLIKELPGFTAKSAGDWHQVLNFGGTAAHELRDAVKHDDGLWFVVHVDGVRACTQLELVY
jgi:hypothetical protein